MVLGDLYSRGATIVSSERAYGIYFRREDALYLWRLIAEDDRSAEELMEAAREKEVIVEEPSSPWARPRTSFWARVPGKDHGMILLRGRAL